MFRNDLEGCRWFRSGKIPSKGSVNALGEKINMKIQENSVKKPRESSMDHWVP